MYSRRSCITRKPQASTFSASRPKSHGSDGRSRACAASSGTRSRNSRSWSFSGRSATRRSCAEPEPRRDLGHVGVDVVAPERLGHRHAVVAVAHEVAGRRPGRREIGGIASPRRWAAAIRSQRERSRGVVGRKPRSKSRARSTVPTIGRAGRPAARGRPGRCGPSASTTSSNGRISRRRPARAAAAARRRPAAAPAGRG